MPLLATFWLLGGHIARFGSPCSLETLPFLGRGATGWGGPHTYPGGGSVSLPVESAENEDCQHELQAPDTAGCRSWQPPSRPFPTWECIAQAVHDSAARLAQEAQPGGRLGCARGNRPTWGEVGACMAPFLFYLFPFSMSNSRCNPLFFYSPQIPTIKQAEGDRFFYS